MTDQPAFVIRAQAEVKFEADIDLVAYFRDLSAHGKRGYFACDLRDLGYDDEFERPLAYLMQELEESIEGFDSSLGAGVRASAFSGSIDWNNRGLEVVRRGAVQAIERHAQSWTEGDYERLLDSVPWMRPEVEAEVSVHPGQGVLPI